MFSLSFIYFLFWLSSLQGCVHSESRGLAGLVEALCLEQCWHRVGAAWIPSEWLTSQLQPRAALWFSDPLVPDNPSLLVLHPELQVNSNKLLFWRNASGNTRSLQSNTKLGWKTPVVTNRKEKAQANYTRKFSNCFVARRTFCLQRLHWSCCKQPHCPGSCYGVAASLAGTLEPFVTPLGHLCPLVSVTVWLIHLLEWL